MKIIKVFIVCAVCLVLIGWGKSDLQKGKDYFRAGESTKAIDLLTKAIQSNPKEQEAYFFRGATFSAIGQFDRAIEDYTKVIELNPKHKEAYWSRGYCYQNKRMDDKAIADYTESLKLGTKMKALVYELRAGAYFRKSMLNEAEADLKSALRLNPNNQKALRGLDDIKQAKKDPNFNPSKLQSEHIGEKPMYGGVPPTPEVQKAHDRFIKEVIKDFGSREEAFKASIVYAWDHLKKGDLKTAMKRFNQAWLLDSNNAGVYFGFGRILGLQKNSKEAIEMYTKTIELNPKHENAYFNRGQEYFRLNRYNEAISDFSETIEINPKAADAYNSRGYVYFTTHRTKGNLDKALSDFNKSIEIDPNNGLAYHNRANVYFMKQEYDKIWTDVYTMKSLGINVDPMLIEHLKKKSGRRK